MNHKKINFTDLSVLSLSNITARMPEFFKYTQSKSLRDIKSMDGKHSRGFRATLKKALMPGKLNA